MALAGTETALGLSLAAAAGSTDATGIATWTAIASATLPFLVSSTLVLPGTMVAAGAVVAGSGACTVLSPALGALWGVASGTTDPIGLAAWLAIGAAFTSFYASNGQAQPTVFVANPLGGPVTGVGTFSCPSKAGVGPLMAVAAGSLDAVGIAKWTAIGTALLSHIESNAIFLPTVLVAPPGGGPLTGTGTII